MKKGHKYSVPHRIDARYTSTYAAHLLISYCQFSETISVCLKKCHLELLDSPLLLKAVGEAKRFIHRVFLENVQSSVQRYLPTGVGDDMPSMSRTSAIEGPLESDAGALTGSDDGVEVFSLAANAALVRARDEFHVHLVFGGFFAKDTDPE